MMIIKVIPQRQAPGYLVAIRLVIVIAQAGLNSEWRKVQQRLAKDRPVIAFFYVIGAIPRSITGNTAGHAIVQILRTNNQFMHTCAKRILPTGRTCLGVENRAPVMIDALVTRFAEGQAATPVISDR